MIISEKLKIARTACGFTQQQIADILGIDRSSYAYYETGKTTPSAENLRRLAALFGVDIEWFLGDIVPGLLSEPEDVFSVNRAIRASKMSELSDEERELVGLFRMLKGTADEDKLAEALRSVDALSPDSRREDENENG